MDTEKKREQIIGAMKECLEQVGFPDLRYENAIAHPNAEEDNVEHIEPSAIRFSSGRRASFITWAKSATSAGRSLSGLASRTRP